MVRLVAVLSRPSLLRTTKLAVTLNESRIFVEVASSQNPQLGERLTLGSVDSSRYSDPSSRISLQVNLSMDPVDRLPSNVQSVWPSSSSMRHASAPLLLEVTLKRASSAG